MERRRITFSGRVQGVGFRATARSLASAFRVTGWVRNEPDGSVVAEIQGEPAEIDRYLAALRAHMGRLIRGESAEALPPEPAEAQFEVRR